MARNTRYVEQRSGDKVVATNELIHDVTIELVNALGRCSAEVCPRRGWRPRPPVPKPRRRSELQHERRSVLTDVDARLRPRIESVTVGVHVASKPTSHACWRCVPPASNTVVVVPLPSRWGRPPGPPRSLPRGARARKEPDLLRARSTDGHEVTAGVDADRPAELLVRRRGAWLERGLEHEGVARTNEDIGAAHVRHDSTVLSPGRGAGGGDVITEHADHQAVSAARQRQRLTEARVELDGG